MRPNNPVNLPFTEGCNWLGLEPSILPDSFCHFGAVHFCVAAWLITMRSYFERHIVSIKDVIDTYSSDEDNSGYKHFVCRELSEFLSSDVNPYSLVWPDRPLFMFAFCKAVCWYENHYVLSMSDFDRGFQFYLSNYSGSFQVA